MQRHAVIRIDPETGEEKRYESCSDAGREMCCHRITISKAAYKGRMVNGYLWRWEDGATPETALHRKAPELREPLDFGDLLHHPCKYRLGQKGKGWVPAGRVLSAFEGVLGDGWRGCAKELLDGFKAPLDVLLAHVANWYTSQHGTMMDSDEIARITEQLKKEYGDG
jgi:hypothetical protein